MYILFIFYFDGTELTCNKINAYIAYVKQSHVYMNSILEQLLIIFNFISS